MTHSLITEIKVHNVIMYIHLSRVIFAQVFGRGNQQKQRKDLFSQGILKAVSEGALSERKTHELKHSHLIFHEENPVK